MSCEKLKTLDSFEKRDVNQNSLQNDETNVTSSLVAAPLWQKLDEIEEQMSKDLSQITFLSEKIEAIYNPLQYARNMHCEFMSKFLDGTKSCVFIGMNPGPFGMCQTGVPFGNVATVRDWLKLTSDVGKPEKELPARPVDGLRCRREEESGKRFWGVIKDICGTPEQFFKHCFIYNYCPLAFLAATGKNITPAELKSEKKKKLQEICNSHLQSALDLLKPEIVISIGKYVEDRVEELQKNGLIDPAIIQKCIPHPSRRAPNNADWPKKAHTWFEKNDILSYLKEIKKEKKITIENVIFESI